MSRNIYVASSWRNHRQQSVVKGFRSVGHSVYDFKHPNGEDDGFHWSVIDTAWEAWDARTYIKGLSHPAANLGFENDIDAMEWADTCVLVLPSGRSSHLEAGWFTGCPERKLIILLDETDPIEPELMYKMADLITPEFIEVLRYLE